MSLVSVKSRAHGLKIEDVDIVVVDDNAGMLKILMTILSAFKVKRARYYTSAEQALTDMISEPPHILITDWIMSPIDGLDMLQTMRNKAMHPLCNTAIMVLTGEPSRKNMVSAMENAASYFMVKPISPRILMERLKWVCNDDRDYVFNGDQMVITGQKTDIVTNRRESPLPEPLLLDCVQAEIDGVPPVLRKAYSEISKLPSQEVDNFVVKDDEEFILDDVSEEDAVPDVTLSGNTTKPSQKDDEVDWLDSNFSWAFTV